MAKFIEVGSGIFINPDAVAFVTPDGGSKSIVTLVTGKTISVDSDAHTLVKKLSA
ncbi:MAG TPA: hypothetical protein VFC39_18640 [Acidobacteriaceae bacterium]|nr:hypothetical protein [Acidobacteriaceae bacterium]